MTNRPVRVEKPWGYELIWAHSPHYVGKILHVRAGESLSLQYHEEKDETLYLLSGELRFWLGPSADELTEIALAEGEAVRIEPGVVHRMEAVRDSEVLEASTPQLEDVVRLNDRYGRVPDAD